jgi:hypothetical protein
MWRVIVILLVFGLVSCNTAVDYKVKLSVDASLNTVSCGPDRARDTR